MNTMLSTSGFVFPLDGKSAVHKLILPETEAFNQWDIHELIHFIVRHYHSKAKTDIIEIYELAQRLFSESCDKHPELAKLVEALFLFFDDLSFHLKNEEQILFPNIIHLHEKKLHEGSFDYGTSGIIKEYSLKMRREHEEIERQFEWFRTITNDYKLPDSANLLYASLFSKMKQFESEKKLHMQIESQFLLTKVMQLYEN